MVIFSKLALAAASIAGVAAIPFEPSVKHATHRMRRVTRDLHVESYHPPNTYKTFGSVGIASPLKKRGQVASIEDSAIAFIEEQLNVSKDGFRIRSSASTESGGHVWVQQVVNGIPVANAVGSVGFNRAENVVAFSSNFGGSSLAPQHVASPTPTISKEQAITAAEKKLNGKRNAKVPTLEYYVKQDGSLALTYVVEIQTADGNHWYEAFVDASNSDITSTNDFVADASYWAVDPQVQDVTKGYNNYADPADTGASPNGWHTVGSTTSTDTSGNNVVSYKGSVTGTTQQSSSGQVFNYKYDTSVGPTSGQNVDAARVNTFFISNKIHDVRISRVLSLGFDGVP